MMNDFITKKDIGINKQDLKNANHEIVIIFTYALIAQTALLVTIIAFMK